jgi:hypothetical protein
MDSEQTLLKRHFSVRTWLAFVVLAALGLSLSGCHRLRTPQPPLVGQPGSLRGLTAIRAGNQVWISWTMSQKTLNKLVVRGFTTVHICRRETESGPCTGAGEPLQLTPGTPSSFTEMLPADLASGNPRVLTYSLELVNPKTQSAGTTNEVVTIAGAPPPPLQGLTAEMQPDGVALSWPSVPGPLEQEESIVRLYRTLISFGSGQTVQGQLTPSSSQEEQVQTLEADARKGRILDKNIRSGGIYRYSAQRLVRITVGSQKLELSGELSQPACIHTADLPSPDSPAGVSGAVSPTGSGCQAPKF